MGVKLSTGATWFFFAVGPNAQWIVLTGSSPGKELSGDESFSHSLAFRRDSNQR